MTKIEDKTSLLENRLEELMEEFPDFKVFVSIFHKDGEISWTITESLCLACVFEWMDEIRENKEIKHLNDYEVH